MGVPYLTSFQQNPQTRHPRSRAKTRHQTTFIFPFLGPKAVSERRLEHPTIPVGHHHKKVAHMLNRALFFISCFSFSHFEIGEISQKKTSLKTNMAPVPGKNGENPKGSRIIFQPSIFRGKLLVSGRGINFGRNTRGLHV